ncbi:MAG: AraC family transcriptional regulator [Pseudomonadota bacterium]
MSKIVNMVVQVYRDEREAARSAMRAHAGFDVDADLRIARLCENVDEAQVFPGAAYHTACLIERGSMIRLDRATPRIQRGSLTIEPTWFEGTFTNDEQTTWSTVYISAARLDEIGRGLMPGGRAPTLKRVEGEADPVLKDLISTCARTLLRPYPVSRLELDGWAQVIGAHLLRSHSEEAVKSAQHDAGLPPAALRIALDAIEDGLDGDLSLAHLARLLDMGTTRLSAGFRASTGSSLHCFVTERRVERARELLEDPELSLAEIAFTVGFSSQSHLTSVFRTKLGVTPGRYRSLRMQ